jgi:hypothetical protein
MSDEHWLREVLKETETEISNWPEWLKESAKQSKPDESDQKETESFDDYEELKQQTG